MNPSFDNYFLSARSALDVAMMYFIISPCIHQLMSMQELGYGEMMGESALTSLAQ